MYPELTSIANTLKPWLESTIPVFFLLWLCARTGSWYPLIFIAWKLLVSKDENKSKCINDYLANQRDVNQFRAFTTMKVRTIKHAEKIIKWCEEKDVSHEEIKICSNFFDIEELRIKEERLPSKKFKAFILFPAISLISLLFYISILMAANNSAALQFKNEGKNFFINETEAKPMFTFSNETLTKKSCSENTYSQSKIFNPEEIKIICEFFDSKELKPTVERNIINQRFLFGYFSFVFATLIYMIFIYIRKINTCTALLKKLTADNTN